MGIVKKTVCCEILTDDIDKVYIVFHIFGIAISWLLVTKSQLQVDE